MKLHEILEVIRPGAAYILRNNAISEWHDKTQTQPTQEEIKAGMIEVEKRRYRELRSAEYPSIREQLDAIWKGGEAVEEMRQRIMAVKEKYPKGE